MPLLDRLTILYWKYAFLYSSLYRSFLISKQSKMTDDSIISAVLSRKALSLSDKFVIVRLSLCFEPPFGGFP